MILGGVKIDYIYGLDGHSDADVLIHAIIDSLFGACALGDIGRHFPDNNSYYKGISSLLLLEKTCDIIKDKGYKIVNIDSIIVAQQPKLINYIDSMVLNISKVCNMPLEDVNVKATTEEYLGFTGLRLWVRKFILLLVIIQILKLQHKMILFWQKIFCVMIRGRYYSYRQWL